MICTLTRPDGSAIHTRLDVRATRYSHAATGGPDTAELVATGDKNALSDVLTWLNCRVVIHISAETAAAIAPLIIRTQADPSWTATIAGPSLASAGGQRQPHQRHGWQNHLWRDDAGIVRCIVISTVR